MNRKTYVDNFSSSLRIFTYTHTNYIYYLLILITVIEVFVCLFVVVFFAGKYLQFVAGYLREKKKK